ncbi:hypothetical protein CEXT_32551 [Caerostris extrusa]|uniref:Ig-like domain-containing protein n=1 Tax=Caerostris extrusa TaxID=172846 RepID=A0AAV4VAK5_CAEEX|nr:hypothetical protein CEXT_32551 [Caerostris extrusa]
MSHEHISKLCVNNLLDLKLNLYPSEFMMNGDDGSDEFLVTKISIPSVLTLPVPEYKAVAGGDAHLPCNFTLPSDPEVVSLMLWYREQGESSNLYRGLPERHQGQSQALYSAGIR